MTYKLFYFNFKALAEPIRFMLSYGNLDFEDNRIEKADWPKFRETNADFFPMGQMPVLEMPESGGKKIHQSASICRFLAKKVGLAGKTDYENFEIDSIVDTINDFRSKIGVVSYEADPKIQEAKRKVLNAETIPFYLNKLDAIAKKNNGFFALNRLTWADLYFTALIDYMNFMAKQDLLEKHANLKKVTTNVLAIESINKWVAKRPKTDA